MISPKSKVRMHSEMLHISVREILVRNRWCDDDWCEGRVTFLWFSASPGRIRTTSSLVKKHKTSYGTQQFSYLTRFYHFWQNAEKFDVHHHPSLIYVKRLVSSRLCPCNRWIPSLLFCCWHNCHAYGKHTQSTIFIIRNCVHCVHYHCWWYVMVAHIGVEILKKVRHIVHEIWWRWRLYRRRLNKYIVQQKRFIFF